MSSADDQSALEKHDARRSTGEIVALEGVQARSDMLPAAHSEEDRLLVA